MLQVQYVDALLKSYHPKLEYITAEFINSLFGDEEIGMLFFEHGLTRL
jgi:hypothetical protein